MNEGQRRAPTYKQMAFETAVRNPERYIPVLQALKDYEGLILNDKNLLDIVTTLYREGIVESDGVDLDQPEDVIKKQVISVNSTRRADGSFPSGYASRFWTYMRTPSELGFVYARYGKKFLISPLVHKLLLGELDEQELFAIQSFRGNRRSPYRNVSNNYNFFKFIFSVLKKRQVAGKELTLEQFVIAMFSENGDADEYLQLIENNKFPDLDTVYDFLLENYSIHTVIGTVTRDYPDVVIRLLAITGLISIRYSGKKFIGLNKNKIDFFDDLAKLVSPLSEAAVENDALFYEEMNSDISEFMPLIEKYRQDDKIEASEYKSSLARLIERYSLNENLIKQDLIDINSSHNHIEAFKEIPRPLKLEFYIALLLSMKYGDKFNIRPNYKADHEGKPYSHAPGGGGDIDVFSENMYWLIEVTLIQNKTQQLNSETATVFRHMVENQEFKTKPLKYLSFIAPHVHHDTDEFFEASVFKYRTMNLKFKSYTIDRFIDVTLEQSNLNDMERNTTKILETFLNGV
ncbi:MAG: restriction endonuclease [Candidatus Saccharibacteria bacterium]|nr:restriction endonuclease [Candidatus Saccharibacteria bacterium]